MGSGLSMTSVNKIKELAAAREYSLALEIIDSQDLSKSLNPQFLRLCGEVYIANGRYIDARRILLMAHRMAPEAKRVIYSLVDLYLRMGYKELADFYYRLYMHDADPGLPETIQMNYIYDKAQGCPFEEIETLLFPMYSDVMDYDWSFELYLLMMLQGKNEEANDIKLDYIASFKTGKNTSIIEAIEDNQTGIEEVFYIYSKEEILDDSPEQEELRNMELPLLKEDELRINPKEAEIQILFDDNEKISFGAKLKLKKHLREEEKLAKKMQDEGEAGEGDDSQAEQQQEVETEQEVGEEADSNRDEETVEPAATKMNVFKKLFLKKKSEEIGEDSVVEEDTIVGEDTIVEEDTITKKTDVLSVVDDIHTTEVLTESSEETHKEVEAEAQEDKSDDTLVESAEETTLEECVDEFEVSESEQLVNEEVETAALDSAEQESLDDVGDSVMQEIYEKKKISIVTEMGEDTFINTQDGDYESGNPFDELLHQERNTVEPELDTKSSFVIEEVELQDEDDEFEVDDFSQDFDVAGFDLDMDNDVETETPMENVLEDETEDSFVKDTFVEEEAKADVEDTFVEEEAEADVEDTFVEEETEADVEDTFVEEEAEADVEDTFVEEEIEATEEDALAEEEIEATEEDAFAEEEIEAVIEEVYEDEPEFIAEEIPNQEEIRTSINTLDGESVYNTLQQKGKLDYPEFKSSLFPEFGESVASVENNFNEIMTEGQDKINENLLKEEQMQREAEALLASLGIDLGLSSTTVGSVNNDVTQGEVFYNSVPSSVKIEESNSILPEEADVQISEDELESVKKYCPSRDELKASLKIDSVKKSILKQIKEYR